MTETAPEKTTKGHTKERNRAIGASVPPDVFDKLEDYRWKHRLTRSQVLADAIEEFIANHAD